MTEVKPLSPPQTTKPDKVIGAIKALVGELPSAALAMEITSWFVRTPFEKRTEEWQQTVGETLHRLATEKHVDLEVLQKDERFVDTVMQATQIALRTSQKEKREALRNAILNSALPHAPEESERQMYLQLVDKFTVWHLRLLHLFADAPRWFAANGRSMKDRYTGSLGHIAEEAFSELGGKRDFYDQVWSDLSSAGLVNTASLHAQMSSNGLTESRASNRGRAFLQFISDDRKGAG